MFLNQKQRFSIRKYSFGAASVLLGTVLLGLAVPEVSADSVQEGTIEQFSSTDNVAQSNAGSTGMEAVAKEPVSETDAMSTVSASSETSNAEVSESQNQEITAPAPTEVDEEAQPVSTEAETMQPAQLNAEAGEEEIDWDAENKVFQAAINALREAEEAFKAVETKIAELKAKGALISSADKNEVTQLNNALAEKKNTVWKLVQELRTDAFKNSLTEELNKINPIQVPEERDTGRESNGQASGDDIEDKTAESNVPKVDTPKVEQKAGTEGGDKDESASIDEAIKAVNAAEEALDNVRSKIVELNGKGVINSTDKFLVEKLNAEVEELKQQAYSLVHDLKNDIRKEGLLLRLAGIKTAEVKVNDTNHNGRPDDIDDALEEAEKAVDAAEEAEKTGDAIEIKNAKDNATLLVNKLNSIPESKELIGRLNRIQIPEASDVEKELDDQPDNGEEPKADEEETTKAAEGAVEADGVVNPAEKQEVDALNAEVTKSKKLAEQFVDTLPENSETKELKDRLSKVTTSEVKVNDADSNGKEDAEEAEVLRVVKNAVATAEQVAQSAKTKKAEAEADGVVTEAEKAEVDKLNSRITDSKKQLSTLLDNLSASTETATIKDRLSKVTTSEVTVGTADNKVKSDKPDTAIARADFYTTSTEIKAKAAAAKKTAVEADGVVNPAEKQEVDALNAEVTKSKKLAEQFVDTLPENSETKELKDRLSKVTTSEVKVNDADSNGKEDAEEAEVLRVVKNAVATAEQVAQSAKTKKAEAEADGVVTEAEKAEVDKLNSRITDSKKQLSTLLDNLSASTETATI
ncbi:GA-like domain-containing protein, partial [Streptococcus jiangjianxini]|uniref:GA-like domain-containing protein n=1 Tax=Streptococcus jiangjianxini TaxID=3161189 RepID=UPI0032ED30F3